MQPVLSIIIVNWNTRELLLDCLSSLFDHPIHEPFDVWVVDNASTDGSAEAVRRQHPQVKLIECSENLGFAGGNNLALERIDSAYALLLNSDTRVLPGALQMLLRFMEDHPRTGAAGPNLLNPDGTIQDSCFPFPSLSREFWRLFHLDLIYPYGQYDVTRWDKSRPHPVDVIQGTCLMLRREALRQVGLLDQGYFMYTEEVDLCYRLKKAGWSLFWLPEARVIHYGGQSTRQAAPRMFLSLYQTKVRFFRKHYGPVSSLVYKLILLCASLARLLVTPLAWLEKPPERARSFTLARRYLDLLAHLPGM